MKRFKTYCLVFTKNNTKTTQITAQTESILIEKHIQRLPFINKGGGEKSKKRQSKKHGRNFSEKKKQSESTAKIWKEEDAVEGHLNNGKKEEAD